MSEPTRLVDRYEISAPGYPGTYTVNVRNNRTPGETIEQVRRIQMDYPSMTQERHQRFVSALNKTNVVISPSQRSIGYSGNLFQVRKNNRRK